MDMQGDFKVMVQGGGIKVTHAEGHEYTFHLPLDGDSVATGDYREAKGATHSAIFFLSDARRIAGEALRKARREGHPGQV